MQYETTVENYNRMEEKRHKIETDIECFRREEQPSKIYRDGSGLNSNNPFI